MQRPRLIVAAIVIAIALVGVAAGATAVLAGGKKSLADDPPPAFFATTDTAALDAQVADAEERADTAMDGWLADHPQRDDRAFAAFALGALDPPPTAATQADELALLHRLAASRTPAQALADAWFETHATKDIWKLYGKQAAQLPVTPDAPRAKQLVKATYGLAKDLAQQAKDRVMRPSPYVADPTLDALNKDRFAGQLRVSYPAKHAVIAAAQRTVLERLDPQRQAAYAWMQSQVDFSRLSAGGHYPSDVVAGAFLGRLIGRYILARESVA